MIIKPPRTHNCPTPRPWDGFYDPETLWRCDECLRWWVAREIGQSGSVCYARGIARWNPVTRWDRKLLRRISTLPNPTQ